MCGTCTSASPGTFTPADVDWSGEPIRLDPVDEVQVLTVCDNTVDIFLLDQGPGRAGHFDHTAGLSGLVHRLGRPNLPAIVHPEFWTRRRLAIPGREPLETPTTSRRALAEVGFDVVEQQQPSFILDGALLVTGGLTTGTRSQNPGPERTTGPAKRHLIPRSG